MVKNMSLISYIFGINKSLPEEEEKKRGEEEGPCTSYYLEDRHGRCLDFQILSKYLGEYKPHFAAFRGATAFPQYI